MVVPARRPGGPDLADRLPHFGAGSGSSLLPARPLSGMRGSMGRRVLGCVFLCCLRDGTSAWGCLRSVALSWEDLGEGEGEVLGLSHSAVRLG